MTTNHHTQIATSTAANASNLNAPLGELDTALTNILAGDANFTGMQIATPNAVTLDGSGIATLTQNSHTISSNSGITDTLSSISGLNNGEYVFLRATSGHTITIEHNTILNVSGQNETMTNSTVFLLIKLGGIWYTINAKNIDPTTISYTVEESKYWPDGPTDPTNIDEAINQLAYSKGQGHIIGYEVDALTTTNIVIQPGECVSDDYTSLLVENTSIGVATGTSGTGGLDTGTIGPSSWYYVFVIYNPSTDNTNGLMSLSATSPTMPSGYTKKRRVGAVKTDSSNNLYLQYTARGSSNRRQVVYDENTTTSVFQILSLGNISQDPTFDSQDVSAVVPVTASHASIVAQTETMSTLQTVYWQRASTSSKHFLLRGNTATFGTVQIDIPVTSLGTFGVASSGTGDEDLNIYCIGYWDNLLPVILD